MHAMLECSHARQFWTAARDMLHLHIPRLHPDTWATGIMCLPVFDQRKRELIISIMAAIGDSRNRWAHDDLGFDAIKSVETIMESVSVLEKKSAVSLVKQSKTGLYLAWSVYGDC